MTALREIIASFGVDFDKEGNLAKGDKHVNSLTEKLGEFGKAVIGAFAVEKVFEFGKSILEQADVLAKQAGALGVSTEELQGWQHAADLSGSSAEEFTAAFTKFNRNVNEAGESAAGPAAKAFKALGVTIKDSTGQMGAPIDLLDGVVAGLENIHDPAKRTALVMDLFGKSGARLLPLFNEGPEGIRKLRAEVAELGAGFDEAFLKDAQEVNDNVTRLNLGLRGMATQILKEVLPGIVAFTKGAVEITKRFIHWVKGTTLVRAALTGLGVKGVMMLVTSIPQLIARFGGLTAILGRVALFALRVVAPFLILDDIIGFLSGDDSAIGAGLDKAFGPGTADDIRNLVFEMVKFFGLFKTEPNNVRKSFASLPQDLEKDLGGFGAFLGGWGQGIVEVGLFAVNALTGGWANFVDKAKAAGSGFLLAIKIVWTELKFAGLSAAAAMSDAFDGVWNSIISGAQAALNALIDVLSKLPGTADAVKDLRTKVAGLDGARGEGKAVEVVSQQRDKERLALAAESDRIGAVATAPASGAGGTVTTTNTTVAPVINNNTVVNVQGGADVANRVGKAVGKNAGETSLRGVKAALVPTPG